MRTERGVARNGRLASLLASVLLAGCAALPQSMSLTEVTRVCMAHNPAFTDAWGCIQAGYATTGLAQADPRLRGFLRLGDSLAMQVAANTLSDGAARKRLSAAIPVERRTIVEGVTQLVYSLTTGSH